MRTLDLFCGIGGWSFGLEPLGFDIVAAVENEPWKRAIHRTAWPRVPVFKDIRKVTGDAVLRSVGRIDLICGSPPCQDASAANVRGRGIDGSETGLFLEALRLVRELRPRWVCLENVPRLRTRGAGRVLDALEREGYACWPLVVGAVHAGAPHERKRVWIVAHANGVNGRAGTGRANGAQAGNGDCEQPTDTPRLGRPPQGRGRRQDGGGGRDDTAGDHGYPNGARSPIGQGERYDPCQELAASERTAWLLEHPWAGGLIQHLRMADGLSAGVPAARLSDMRSAYGDAVVAQVVQAVGKAILEADRMT